MKPGFLFDIPEKRVPDLSLGQYMTPAWAADLLMDHLDVEDEGLVIEPSCGTGAWLHAIPASVEALGVELAPDLAASAAAATGRRVICGDFRTVELPQPTLIVGNPPYRTRLITDFLARAHELLPAAGRCVFLLSCHLLQTPSLVTRWAEQWSMSQCLVPRTLFPRVDRPLALVTFSKGRKRLFNGFALYREAIDFNAMAAGAKLLLVEVQPKPCWRAVVEWALKKHGGRARVADLYDTIEPRRISSNQWWREKVRQTLQRYFRPIARGEWSLP